MPDSLGCNFARRRGREHERRLGLQIPITA